MLSSLAVSLVTVTRCDMPCGCIVEFRLAVGTDGEFRASVGHLESVMVTWIGVA